MRPPRVATSQKLRRRASRAHDPRDWPLLRKQTPIYQNPHPTHQKKYTDIHTG
jgi:hypothetical protein